MVTRSPSGSWSWPAVQRRHEVADDGVGNRRGLGEPGQQRIPSPPGYVHQAVDLRDYLSFERRIARNTLPSRLICFMLTHSSAWEIRK